MVKKDEAKKFLGDVPNDKMFYVSNGPILKNLHELEWAIGNMTDETYKFHANREKNDFSNWISEVVGDKILAMDMTTARNRDSAVKKIKNRMHSLRKMAG